LDGTELAISESQERMAVVVGKEDEAAFSRYAAEENIEVTQVAKVTDTGRFRMYWRDELILDLSRKFLDTNGVAQKRKALIREQDIRIGQIEHRKPGGIGRASANEGDEELLPEVRELYGLLSDLNCAGKRGLIEYFDSTIGAGSVLMPLGGKYQLTPAAGMAAKLPVLSGDTQTATLMSYGFDPRVSKESPFHGAMYAVLESLTRIAAMGGDITKARLSFQEYFPKLGRVPTRWASPVMALLGGLKAQMALGVPSIGGKDSMSGSFRHLDVAPTLVSFAIVAADARTVLSPEFKKTGSKIVLLECKRDAAFVPDFEAFRKNAARLHELAKKGKLLSAGPVGAGGLFVSIARMAFGNRIGAVLFAPMKRLLLFENYGSLLLEVGADEDVKALLKGLDYQVIGETVDSAGIELRTREGVTASNTSGSVVLPLSEIEERWETPLVSTFPVQAEGGPPEGDEAPLASYEKRATFRTKPVRPRVFLPVFPGTNCEVDSRRAFERAGAEVCVVNLLSQNHEALAASIARMAEEIGKSQIVMIPGGFSGGDEPEGSAKFIAAVFRSPQMREATTELLEKRGGLMLGICNGFQALVKLGLLPYGRITEPDEAAPTLTYNTIGRHMSKLVRARVGSALSPWLAHAQVGDVHTLPVSHGEGRFVAGETVLQELLKNGQIATQYVDMDDRPTYDIRFNPNGSAWAIEGITSPDGRVFGRMGHSERNAPGLYVNVPGDFDDGIFASGVAYFK
ncbi:MAG: phosphoribosylformylglycinamidine synthase subunit PurQ, partial [Clostridiales Family XIII bacterium]|nr:phosphoribosylformylglycinamidine synthase subunit PurQ [Clostridiales Family XIII bacterium]